MKRFLCSGLLLAVLLAFAAPATAGHGRFGRHYGYGIGRGVLIGAASAVIVGGFLHHHYVSGYAPTVVYVPAPPPRVIVVEPAPGYSQSDPQVSTYDVWVPAHYNERGEWVEGHYERRTVPGGRTQIWVDGHWEYR